MQTLVVVNSGYLLLKQHSLVATTRNQMEEHLLVTLVTGIKIQ